jgi:endoglucanase
MPTNGFDTGKTWWGEAFGLTNSLSLSSTDALKSNLFDKPAVVSTASSSLVQPTEDLTTTATVEVTPAAVTSETMQFPLSAQGNQIVDASGNPVQLAGINWYGMNYLNVPDGLWARDYKSMISQMKDLGFNLLRIPFSYDSIYAGADTISGRIDYSLGANSELQGKRPIEVLDAIVQEAGRQGLLVLLGNQNFRASGDVPELWYEGSYTEGNWIDMWKTLADRYRNQTNIIGADLKNEPHGAATWGNGNLATDWGLAAERAGNQILSVNPNWLIVVQGMGDDPAFPSSNNPYWWGENLEGVGRDPVNLSNPSRLVYSPHTYGPGNARSLGIEQFLGYLNDSSFPNNLESRWNQAFGYIQDQNLGAMLVGEFGGPGSTVYDRDGQWEQKFVSYLDQRDLSWAYWAWNPNPYAGGGGILGNDWTTVNQDRIDLLKPLLDEATPTPAFNSAVGSAPMLENPEVLL